MNIRENLQRSLLECTSKAFHVGCSIEERYPDTSDPQELMELHDLFVRLSMVQTLLSDVRRDLTVLDRYLNGNS